MLEALLAKQGVKLALRLLPYLGIGLTAILLFVQTTRLESSRAEARAAVSERDLLAAYVRTQDTALKQKDAVISQQNEGLEAVLKSRWQDRQAYLANYAAADGRAKSHEQRARELLNLPRIEGDELARCRAARELIVKEIRK